MKKTRKKPSDVGDPLAAAVVPETNETLPTCSANASSSGTDTGNSYAYSRKVIWRPRWQFMIWCSLHCFDFRFTFRGSVCCPPSSAASFTSPFAVFIPFFAVSFAPQKRWIQDKNVEEKNAAEIKARFVSKYVVLVCFLFFFFVNYVDVFFFNFPDSHIETVSKPGITRRKKVSRPEASNMTATKFNCVCCDTPLTARMWGSASLRRVEVSTPNGWQLIRQAGKFSHSMGLVSCFLRWTFWIWISYSYRLTGLALLNLHRRRGGSWLARCPLGSATFGPEADKNAPAPRPRSWPQSQSRAGPSNDIRSKEYALQTPPWCYWFTGMPHFFSMVLLLSMFYSRAFWNFLGCLCLDLSFTSSVLFHFITSLFIIYFFRLMVFVSFILLKFFSFLPHFFHNACFVVISVSNLFFIFTSWYIFFSLHVYPYYFIFSSVFFHSSFESFVWQIFLSHVFSWFLFYLLVMSTFLIVFSICLRKNISVSNFMAFFILTFFSRISSLYLYGHFS